MISRAVEAAFRKPIAPRKLQAGLDGLRAAVAEERARQSRELRQPLGDLALQRVKEQVRAVDHLARLLGDGVGEPLVSVTERAHADAGEQVEIFASLRVEHAHALAADQHDWRAPVGLDDMFRLELANAIHLRTFLLMFRPFAGFPI